MRAAEAQRHRELDPCLVLAVVERSQFIECRAVAGVGSAAGQVVTQPADPGRADDIQPRSEEVLRGDQLQFAALDDEPLGADFRTSLHRFRHDRIPVKFDRRDLRIVHRTQRLAIVHRQSDQQPQPPLRHLHAVHAAEHAAGRAVVILRPLADLAGDGVLQLRLEAEELLAGERFRSGRFAAFFLLNLVRFPGLAAPRERQPLGVQVAVGEVQVPVSVDDVADVVTETPFKIDRGDIAVHLGDQDAVRDAGDRARARDAVERQAATLEQRLTQLGLELLLPRGGEQVADDIVVVVIGQAAEAHRAAGRGHLRQLRDIVVAVLRVERVRAAQQQVVGDVVVVLEHRRGIQLGIEGAERRFHAEPRIRLLDESGIAGLDLGG